MPAIIVRLAKPEDLPSLVDLQIEFERFFQNTRSEKYKIAKSSVEKDIIKLNFSKESFLKTLVAEVNGDIAGKLSFYMGYRNAVPSVSLIHMTGMLIKKEYRGFRIAEKIFNELVNIATKENIDRIVWRVGTSNIPAVKFFERVGGRYSFKEEEEHSMFFEI